MSSLLSIRGRGLLTSVSSFSPSCTCTSGYSLSVGRLSEVVSSGTGSGVGSSDASSTMDSSMHSSSGTSSGSADSTALGLDLPILLTHCANPLLTKTKNTMSKITIIKPVTICPTFPVVQAQTNRPQSPPNPPPKANSSPTNPPIYAKSSENTNAPKSDFSRYDITLICEPSLRSLTLRAAKTANMAKLPSPKHLHIKNLA